MNHCIVICSSFDGKDWKLETTLNWKHHGKATFVPILTVDEEKIYITYWREDDLKRCQMGYSENGSSWTTFDVPNALELTNNPGLTYDAKNQKLVLCNSELQSTNTPPYYICKYDIGATKDWKNNPSGF